jgi:hypothetical protein
MCDILQVDLPGYKDPLRTMNIISWQDDSIVLWNMLRGERAGGNCINYTNVAY